MSDELRPPVARFRLELVLTGNTIEEVLDELHVRANHFDYETMRGRTHCDETGGRHHLVVTEPNPAMTPERYENELVAWFDQRRKVRQQQE